MSKRYLGVSAAAMLVAAVLGFSSNASAQGYGPGMMGGGYGPGYGPGMMQGYGPGYGPGMMGGYGPGMMGGYGPGMMGGYGPGMMGGYGPGMMQGYGPGYGPGMMGGYGPGMMQGYGPGYGPGMMGGGYGPRGFYGGAPGQQLGVDDVKQRLERWLAWRGNPNLKLGEVKEKDSNTIEADIVTKDNSLVQRLVIDRRTGLYRPSGG